MRQLLFVLLLVNNFVFAQNFVEVDRIVQSYPRYIKVEKLVNRISKDFKDDSSKVRAAFKWLTNNIRYDLEELYNPKKTIQFRYFTETERLQKLQAIRDKIVQDAFLTKMGVCEEYAQSFKKIADLLNIEAEIIKGYTRNSISDISKVPNRSNHAWNAVKINKQWIILDATWAAGYIYNGRWVRAYNDYYYSMDPKKIGRTHFPNDRKWQIMLNSSSLKDFYDQPIYSRGSLKSNLKALHPTNGKISIKKNKKVILRFKNLSRNAKLYYNYSGQRYSKKPTISYKDNIAIVSIENPGRDTELYLFLGKALALGYKVDVY